MRRLRARQLSVFIPALCIAAAAHLRHVAPVSCGARLVETVALGGDLQEFAPSPAATPPSEGYEAVQLPRLCSGPGS